MYERHTYDEMVYTLPVKTGKVTLILKFAEVTLRLVRCTSGTQENVCSTLRSEARLFDRISISSRKLGRDTQLMRSTSKSISKRMECTSRAARFQADLLVES